MRDRTILPQRIDLTAQRLARRAAEEIGIDGVEPMIDARIVADDLAKLKDVVERIIGAHNDLRQDVAELEKKSNEIVEFLRNNYELHKETLRRVDGGEEE